MSSDDYWRRRHTRPDATIRRSQVVTTFGPGSIVDLPNDSAMPMGLSYWPEVHEDDIIEEERLQSALGVAYFRQPPPYFERERESPIRLMKFPTYHHCPGCDRLYNEFDMAERKSDGVECRNCGEAMTPSRFIAACTSGHAEDFPYRAWVHGSQTDCTRQLYMKNIGESPGLRDVLVTCGCGAAQTMDGAFNENALASVGVACSGVHPWDPNKNGECEAAPRTLQRGASNFYFAETLSSLSIPPWHDRIAGIVREWRQFTGEEGYPDPQNEEHNLALKMRLRKGDTELTPDDVFDWVRDLQERTSTEFDIQEFKRQEYRAFMEGKSSQAERPKFRVREAEGVPEVLRPFVDKVILADVLEEVRTLIGFRRIDPQAVGDVDDPQSNLVEIREPNLAWLPASQITGEGVFLSFKAGILDRWAGSSGIASRFSQVRANAEGKWEGSTILGSTPINHRFLLLHSFAHALMNQLALRCGYPSGSIRERIYAGDPNEPTERDMAGILVYTGSPDSEGTLGGLVSMGEKEQLGPIAREAVREAAWCSSDPICSETVNPGERTLNLTACHSCMFVPETSCEFFNTLLDRQAVVGDLSNEGGFMSELV